MSNLKIYIHPLSQPARAIMMFVRANSIPHNEVLVDLNKAEQLKDEYAKNVNPMKKVPVINHDGFIVKESVAILRYLTRAFNVPDNWFPKDNQAQAKVDQYLEWQHLNTRQTGTLFFAEKFLVPLRTKQPVDEKRAAKFLKHFKVCLDQIANIWLKDHPFIAGQHISIADLLAAAEMEQTAIGGYDVKDHHPKIREYLERVCETLDPHYNDVHSLVHKIASKVKQNKP